MAARDVRLPVANGDEARQRTHRRGGKTRVVVPRPQLVRQQVERVVVAARHEQVAPDIGERPQELDRHLLARLDSFRMGGHAHHAVRLHERADDAGPALRGQADHPLAHLSELHAQEFLHPEPRGALPAHEGFYALLLSGGRARHVRHERPHELLKRQHRRDRVARNPEHGLARARFRRANAQYGGLAGEDGHAVYEEFSQLLHDGGRVILASCG